MNKNEYIKKHSILLDETTFQILYLKNKLYITPTLIIVVCIALIVFVLIPQIQEIISLRSESEVLPQRIRILSNNATFMSHLNTETLDNQVSIVAQALPSQRGYAAIINAITNTSRASGVSVGDYSFVVGEISTKSAQPVASVSVDLTLNGDLRATSRFIKELYKQLPITAIKKIEATGNTSHVLAEFFFRPIPTITFDANLPIQSLTPQENTVLRTLTEWINQQPQPSDVQTPVSSPSALVPIATESAGFATTAANF